MDLLFLSIMPVSLIHDAEMAKLVERNYSGEDIGWRLATKLFQCQIRHLIWHWNLITIIMKALFDQHFSVLGQNLLSHVYQFIE